MAAEAPFEIFLSYRRDDSSGYAGRLHDALQAKYGEAQVFMDVATIEPGLDFLDAIDRAIQKCDVFVPIIGRRWADIEDARGRRRLDSPTDPVRLETEAALARPGLRIIPVLVDAASMPSVEELPDSLARLSTRTAHELSHSRWRYDVDQLTILLDKIRGQIHASVSEQRPPTGARYKRATWGWEDYERETGHAPALIKLVRELAEQISASTDWDMAPTKNQVAFRSHGRIVLSLQFWQKSNVRVTIPDVGSRPEPDPLPGYSGTLGKERQWSWYVPMNNPAPDLQDVIHFAAGLLDPKTSDQEAEAAAPANNLGREFEEGMYDAYEYLKKQRGYNATYFLQLLREHGGVGAARRLLQSGDHYSDGFLRLVEIGELHHSVESHVLRPRFRELFSDLELDEARHRLKAADFDVDRWEDKPWA